MEVRGVVAVAGTLIVGPRVLSRRPIGQARHPPFANWAQFKPGTIVMQKEVVSMPLVTESVLEMTDFKPGS